MLKYLTTWLLFCSLIEFCILVHAEEHQESVDGAVKLNLEYEKYLQEVVKTLESDPEFKKKLEAAPPEDIKSGKIAKEIDLLHHSVRTKLDELKRVELERLNELVKQQQVLRNDPSFGVRKWRTRHNDGLDDLLRKFAHLDHKNPDTFESHDLEKLIRVALSELETQDKIERDQFKEYEMEKERKYRERLANMTEEQRLNETKHHQEVLEKRKEHPKINQPGAREQLEEVWEKQDHLPKEEFDPKVFFLQHDVNGDGFWDENEMKALLQLEVDKAFNEKNGPIDEYEKQHELEEMRRVLEEHIDTDKNRLISQHEFLEWTKRGDYNRDPEWKTAEERGVYSTEEYNKYVKDSKQKQNNHPESEMNFYPYREDVDPDFYPHYYPAPPTPQYYQHPDPAHVGPGGYAPGGPHPDVYNPPPPPPGHYQQGYPPAPGAYNQHPPPPPPPQHGQPQYQQQQPPYNPQQHPGQPVQNVPHPGQPMQNVQHPGQPVQNVQHPGQQNQQYIGVGAPPAQPQQPQYNQQPPNANVPHQQAGSPSAYQGNVNANQQHYQQQPTQQHQQQGSNIPAAGQTGNHPNSPQH